jgi:voltage-gated potassium channel
MSLRRRFFLAIFALLILVTAGTIGYSMFEGWSYMQSLLTTLQTLTTMGWGEGVRLTSDATRTLSIVLIICGLTTVAYMLSIALQYFADLGARRQTWRRRMSNRIAELKEHFILCGYGRVGREAAQSLKGAGVPFVVVDRDEQAIASAADSGFLCLVGDAARDEVLKEANIEEARGLVAAAGTDAENVVITLSARSLNPKLTIVARASSGDAIFKLRRAGADQVVTPAAIAGRRMAMVAVHPLVVDFLDTVLHTRDRDLILEELRITEGSPLAGATVCGGKCAAGATMLAVKNAMALCSPIPLKMSSSSPVMSCSLSALGSSSLPWNQQHEITSLERKLTRFILIRHGQTEWNRMERFRGRAELALDDTGIRQAEAAAERLSGWQIAAVYSSPLRRALMTAQVLASRLGLAVQPLDGLIDIDFGDWQGLSGKEAAAQDGYLYRQWLERPHEVRFPRGESLQDVRQRITAAIDSLVKNHGEQTVVLVSHNVVCRVLLCVVLGLDNSHFWQLGQDNSAVNVFEVSDGKTVLSLLNDTCHLKHLGL